MTALPRICMSHTVKGTATIRVTIDEPPEGGAAGFDITVPEGRYWIDSLYAAEYTATSIDLLGTFVRLINAQTSDPDAFSGTYYDTSLTYDGFARSYITQNAIAATLQINAGHANTTAAGREVLKRLGFDSLADNPVALDADVFGIYDLLIGLWKSDRGESGNIDEFSDGFGVTNRSAGGVAYPYVFGLPLPRRTVSLLELPAALARWRGVASGFDYSFERHVKAPLMAGEFMRYWADDAATQTYLSAAMTAASTTASVTSGTGLADNEWIVIDGEIAKITSGGTTTTLTLFRPHPVAHAIKAPVSDAWVATYALDNDGGGVSMGEWRPVRRDFYTDFWDVIVPLVRTA